MKQLWQASGSPRAWASETVPGLLPAWWTFWLFGNFLGNIAMRWNPEDVEGFRAYTLFNIGSAFVSVVLLLLALSLVRRISGRIAERAAEEPPPIPTASGLPGTV